MIRLLRRDAAMPLVSAILLVAGAIPLPAGAHEPTRQQAVEERARIEAEAAAEADDSVTRLPDDQVCRLLVRLRDAATGQPLPGLIRVLRADSGRAVPLPREIHRARNWYTVEPQCTLRVPRVALRIEALHGIATRQSSVPLDLTDRADAAVDVTLDPLPRLATAGWTSGNTHLHLMRLSITEADRYLRLVPRGDGLDLVFVSYLRRIPGEEHYITNTLTTADLARLSTSGTLFGNGQEHRHNFGPQQEGYGHVMFLNIARLIEPVSIGPGIMGTGTDGIPLQRGIRQARDDGAAVVWCHNRFGLEDVPNWVLGLVDAQNIFDGGSHGGYEDTYYRYLNIGLRVPFSTGTDWFIYDFSRVYVPLDQPLTVRAWLDQLAAGRSYITNGPQLEFTVDGRPIGDTIALDAPRTLTARARAVGRLDFRALELIHNGRVVHSVPTQAVEGAYGAELSHEVAFDEPGWLAVRVAWENGQTELGRQLFAHTSPIYVELAGRRRFDHRVAEGLRDEMLAAMQTIVDQALLANDAQRQAVLDVYRNAINQLEQRLAAHPR